MASHDSADNGVYFLLGVALAAGFTAWYRERDVWTAYVYPDASSEAHFVAGNYPDFEQCQSSAINALRAIPGGATGGAYECGRKCEFKPEWGMNVCKETRK